MAGYVFHEYPKWVGDVLVENAAEERAHRLTLADGMGSAAFAPPVNTPSPAAIRMRRSRERRREGKRTIRCDISIAQIDALGAIGLLDATIRDDAAIERALQSLLARVVT
ncbi:MAG TPA: hypothetical protein VGM32_21770 [Rhodopila sp.]